MDTPYPVEPEVPLDASGRIDADVVCIACSYNLRGLSLDGRCPECGTAIGRSIQGDYLHFAEPYWVDTLASGMNWIVAQILLTIGLVAVAACGGALASASTGPSSSPQRFELLILLLGSGIGLVGFVGYWRVTTPDPSQIEPSENWTSRKVARTFYVINFAVGLIHNGVNLMNEAPAQVIMIPNMILGMVWTVAILLYAQQIARRIPHEGLARQTRTVMWGLICALGLLLMALVVIVIAAGSSAIEAAAIGGAALACSAVVGVVVFSIWALILVFRYRSALSEAARRARATWASNDTWSQQYPA